MEPKYSEQAPMSIGWYEAEIKRLEAELEVSKANSIADTATMNCRKSKIEQLEAEVARLTKLVQEHQTYQTRQGDKT